MKKMSEEQFRQMIAQLLTTVNPKFIDGDKAQVAMKDPSFPDRFEEFVCGYEVRGQVKEPTPSILELVSTIAVSATTSKFVALEQFKLKKDGGICSYLGGNFKAWFLEGDGKIEDPIHAGTLRYHKLLKAATDLSQQPGEAAIIPELGGEAQAETALSEMRDRMGKQSLGGKGVLLTNGWANIFYIQDQNGVLRAVFVRWGGGGWGVRAFPVDDSNWWLGGIQVFSRNSVLESLEPVPAAS